MRIHCHILVSTEIHFLKVVVVVGWMASCGSRTPFKTVCHRPSRLPGGRGVARVESKGFELVCESHTGTCESRVLEGLEVWLTRGSGEFPHLCGEHA